MAVKLVHILNFCSHERFNVLDLDIKAETKENHAIYKHTGSKTHASALHDLFTVQRLFLIAMKYSILAAIVGLLLHSFLAALVVSKLCSPQFFGCSSPGGSKVS